MCFFQFECNFFFITKHHLISYDVIHYKKRSKADSEKLREVEVHENRSEWKIGAYFTDGSRNGQSGQLVEMRRPLNLYAESYPDVRVR